MCNATTWRDIANGFLLVAALFYVAVTDTFASDTQRVRNQEYNFSVVFPGGSPVCTATSGDQPHGFFVRLSATQGDCRNVDKEPNVSVISVNAYSNATFENSPEEEIAGLCRKGRAGDERGAMKGLTFVGRRSANCQLKQADGSIDIYVVTQAGQWPGAHESQELKAPYINYTASLHSTQDRMFGDLKAFRRVLNSVRIEYPK
jgi:hypothetical protein